MSKPHKQLRDLAIFEISLVDKPAQEPAVIACVKRAPVAKSEPEPPAVTTTEDKSMDPTQMEARIAELEAENAALKAKLGEIEASEPAEMAAMSDLPAEELKHAAKLAKAERAAFLAKSAADRAAIVTPIYKGADGTLYFRGDEKVAALAKRADDAEGKAIAVALAKRAEAELSHLPGTVDEKVETLKAIDALPDAARALLAKALLAADAKNAPLFKAEGTAEGVKVDEVDATPLTKLDKMAKERAAADRVTYAKAYAAVLATPEGARLYGEFSTKSPA